jgi:hypothetical protein
VQSKVCGVCHKPFANGRPTGGVNTKHGEVVVCSPECFLEAHKHAVSFDEMAAAAAKKEPRS